MHTIEYKKNMSISLVRHFHPDWTLEQIEFHIQHKNDLNLCACECGQLCPKKFVNGHGRKGLTKKEHPELKWGGRKRGVIYLKKNVVSYKMCKCGCGRLCKLEFIFGHNKNRHYGERNNFCECNCGQICRNRFVLGHNNRGKRSWAKGLTKETDARIAKISRSVSGKKRTQESIEKNRAANIGKHNRPHTENAKNKISESWGRRKGLNSKIFRMTGKKDFEYSKNNFIIMMRSGWEVGYAKFLDSQNIIWQYEPRNFKLSNNSHYTPDFYLPSLNEYHEVRGRMYPGAQEKLNLFQKDYPGEKLVVIRKIPKIEAV